MIPHLLPQATTINCPADAVEEWRVWQRLRLRSMRIATSGPNASWRTCTLCAGWQSSADWRLTDTGLGMAPRHKALASLLLPRVEVRLPLADGMAQRNAACLTLLERRRCYMNSPPQSLATSTGIMAAGAKTTYAHQDDLVVVMAIA